MDKNFKSGIVAILGPTNSGKSSLMNALIGKNISAVSPRVQTTYYNIMGVLNFESEQIVFVDTPGFQNYQNKIARLLNTVAEKNLSGYDSYIWVFDAFDKSVFDKFSEMKKKVSKYINKNVCVLNKIDKIHDKRFLLPLMETFGRENIFSDVIPISVKRDDGLDSLLKVVRGKLNYGPKLFPHGQVTDKSSDFLISEFIRESVFYFTRLEIPYCIRIEIEKIENTSNIMNIHAVIHSDSSNRKKILIGKNASVVKAIGSRSRRIIERFFEKRVNLKLYIDVEKNWLNNDFKVKNYLGVN